MSGGAKGALQGVLVSFVRSLRCLVRLNTQRPRSRTVTGCSSAAPFRLLRPGSKELCFLLKQSVLWCACWNVVLARVVADVAV